MFIINSDQESAIFWMFVICADILSFHRLCYIFPGGRLTWQGYEPDKYAAQGALPHYNFEETPWEWTYVTGPDVITELHSSWFLN